LQEKPPDEVAKSEETLPASVRSKNLKGSFKPVSLKSRDSTPKQPHLSGTEEKKGAVRKRKRSKGNLNRAPMVLEPTFRPLLNGEQVAEGNEEETLGTEKRLRKRNDWLNACA